MDMTIPKIRLQIVVIVAIPRGKDDSVINSSAEVNHNVVRVTDLCWLYVDL